MNVIGVDPGAKSGAFAKYDGTHLYVHDMPTIQYKNSQKKNKTAIDYVTLVDAFNIMFDGCDHAYIEQVSARKGPPGAKSQGVSSTFLFGESFGAIRCAVAMLHIPVTMISPVKWKSEMGLNDEAEVSRMRALQLFPNFSHFFSRKMDHNRAEAALLAWYGYMMLTVGKVR